MPTAKIRPLTAKEDTAIEYYCDTTSSTFNNWAQSYIRAGYSKCKGWEGNARRVRTKDTVKAGIEAYKAKVATRTARTVESIDAMYQEMFDLAKETKQASSGVSACTGIARLYGMDKDASLDKQEAEALTPDELETLRKQAIELTKPTIKLNTA